MKKIIALLIVFSIIAGVLALDETFDTLTGGRVSYEQDIASGDSMLFIWTSRCPYCVGELKEMNKNENICKYSKCFFINVGEPEARVKKAVTSLKLKDHISKNIVMDTEGILAKKFAVIGVPTFILLRNGKVLDRAYHFDESTIKQVFKK